MPMSREALEGALHNSFPESEIIVEDLAGDDDHWRVIVRSASFKDKPRIACHREVYAALDGAVGEELHALQVVTEVAENA